MSALRSCSPSLSLHLSVPRKNILLIFDVPSYCFCHAFHILILVLFSLERAPGYEGPDQEGYCAQRCRHEEYLSQTRVVDIQSCCQIQWRDNIPQRAKVVNQCITRHSGKLTLEFRTSPRKTACAMLIRMEPPRMLPKSTADVPYPTSAASTDAWALTRDC